MSRLLRVARVAARMIGRNVWSNFQLMTQTDHQRNGNYKKTHPR